MTDTDSSKVPKKKQVSPAKGWCFTFHIKSVTNPNGYTDDDVTWFKELDPKTLGIEKMIVGMETGTLGETPHLQGFLQFVTKRRPMDLKWSKSIKWICARAKKTSSHDVYCSKEGEVILRYGFPREVKVWPMELDWQKDILNKIREEPDDRTIHWYWSMSGEKRKTSTCKYLVIKEKAIILGGKASDVRNGIVDYYNKNETTPELIVINIPRSFSAEYVSYEAFENIKDMCFYSGKYEGGMICGNAPHLFIFANFHPDLEKMSQDRWNIVCID